MDIYASSPSPRSRFRSPLETSGVPIFFKTRSIRNTRSHLHPTTQESEQAPSCNKINPHTTEQHRLLLSPKLLCRAIPPWPILARLRPSALRTTSPPLLVSSR